MKRKGEEEKRDEKEGGNGRGERERRRETPSSLVEKWGKVSLAPIPALCRELAEEKERRTLLVPGIPEVLQGPHPFGRGSRVPDTPLPAQARCLSLAT